MRTKAAALVALKDFEDTFCEIVNAARQLFVKRHKLLRKDYTHRSEASIINDYMVREAERRLGSNHRIKLIRKRNAFLICIDGEWVIKLKRLSRKLRAAGIRTQTFLNFLGQESAPPQMELVGVAPAPTNLHLGYIRDEVEITSGPVYLVAPNSESQPHWDWPLAAAAAHLGLEVTITAAADEPELVEGRVTPKRSAQPAETAPAPTIQSLPPALAAESEAEEEDANESDNSTG